MLSQLISERCVYREVCFRFEGMLELSARQNKTSIHGGYTEKVFKVLTSLSIGVITKKLIVMER